MHYHHESPVTMEDIQQPVTTTPPSYVMLEHVALEPMTNIPTLPASSSSDIAMSSSSTDGKEIDTAMTVDTTVAREDHGTQTELEDTAMLDETLVARVDQGTLTELEPQLPRQIQDDVPMLVEPGTAMISSGTTSQIAQDLILLSSDSSASKDVVDITMGQPEAIDIATSPEELKDTGPDKEALKQDPGKNEVSKTTGLTAIQEDSIVTKKTH